ncbi:MAG: PepSY domain-containing protein [Alphaproteobacteria bacterium]|nr:PepSY domain-containing protein [Alphaproteobacteria bacterium]
MPPNRAPAAGSVATFGNDQVAQRLARALAERFHVQVLSTTATRMNGEPVYRVTVMNPGGNFNDAFAVHVLVVDAKTDKLVPLFRNMTSGYQLAAPPDRVPRQDSNGRTIRRETFTKP